MTASEFLEAWDNGQEQFIISSSGSTGPPKPIVLQREWMIWSAINSGKIIKHNPSDTLLCCLPLDKVGGLMVLVRARVWGCQVHVLEPSSNPLLNSSKAQIVSLTPYQLSHVLSDERSHEHLKSFKEVLIGGSALNRQLEEQIERFNGQTIFRLSYGMSETYSHIAIQTLNGTEKTKGFKLMEGVRLEQDQEHCAIIYAPFCPEGLSTHDVIEFHDDGTFSIAGRKDFVINSGGVKIMAEQIEAMIDAELQPKRRFVISSISDDLLGEKVVLVCENKTEFEGVNWAFVKNKYPYGTPKMIIETAEIPVNDGGKPDRLKVKAMIRQEP